MVKLPSTSVGCRTNTPIEDYTEQYGLWVKREDLSCPPPGPPFSKARGVYAHIKQRTESLIGVLDTVHSQAGHAVAWACSQMGKDCMNFYPVYTKERDEKGDHKLRPAQARAENLGAAMYDLPAGRSCILYHRAKKIVENLGGYMMPNALKLTESVAETAKEVPPKTYYDQVIIPVSSGTIAAGVILGFVNRVGVKPPRFVLHLGYKRSHDAVIKHVSSYAQIDSSRISIVDEEYAYKDVARPGVAPPPWPCNEYYDLKAFRWWMTSELREQGGRTLFWNIG